MSVFLNCQIISVFISGFSLLFLVYFWFGTFARESNIFSWKRNEAKVRQNSSRRSEKEQEVGETIDGQQLRKSELG